MSEYRLHHLTWPEVAERLETARVGVIPLGATEQHGPHLRLGTDYRIAERLAERTVEKAEGLALSTPPLPIGFSPHHTAFPGTLTARTSTLEALLRDVMDSLADHGLTRFVIMNGHGGNLSFLPSFLAQLRSEGRVSALIVHWSMMGRDIVTKVATTDVFGHACEVETSLALAAAPELVRTEALGGPAQVRESAHELLRGHSIPEREVGGFMPRGFEEITDNGALGNPSTAQVEGGHELFEVVTDRTVELIRHLASADDADEVVLRPGW